MLYSVCCVLALVDFTHTLRTIMSLVLGQSWDYPSASEAKQKNVVK